MAFRLYLELILATVSHINLLVCNFTNICITLINCRYIFPSRKTYDASQLFMFWLRNCRLNVVILGETQVDMSLKFEVLGNRISNCCVCGQNKEYWQHCSIELGSRRGIFNLPCQIILAVRWSEVQGLLAWK